MMIINHFVTDFFQTWKYFTSLNEQLLTYSKKWYDIFNIAFLPDMTIAYFIFLTFQMLLLHDTYSINFIQQHKSFQRCNIASCEDNINSTNNKRGLTHNNFFLNMFKCFMYMYISLLNMAYSQSTMWVLCVYYSSNNLKKLEQSSFNEKFKQTCNPYL